MTIKLVTIQSLNANVIVPNIKIFGDLKKNCSDSTTIYADGESTLKNINSLTKKNKGNIFRIDVDFELVEGEFMNTTLIGKDSNDLYLIRRGDFLAEIELTELLK